jgi:hypothetical protein
MIMQDSEESNKDYAKIASADTAKMVNEEDSDRMKDRRMERGGVDGNNRYRKPISNTPNTFGKKGTSEPKPHPTNQSAIETVAARLRARYGASSIIGGTIKKSES